MSGNQKAISSSPLRAGLDDAPGSESMACNKSSRVNMRDPGDSQMDRVLENKYQSEDSEKVTRRSDVS